MKIKYCTDVFLEEFKTNFDKYINMYLNKDIKEIQKIFNEENVKDTDIDFEFKKLKTLKESENTERDNIKIIHQSLKNLTPVQASQEKLWVAMYNTYYIEHIFDYISQNINNKNINNKLKSSIVFNWGVKRSLIVQNLSRMWWLGYYLYDESNNNNPYDFIDFYTESSDIIGKSTIFFSSNLTANKNLRFGILEGIKDLVEMEIIENKRKYYVEINKYFNLVGGVRILDFMSRDEVKKETIEYILDFEEKLESNTFSKNSLDQN